MIPDRVTVIMNLAGLTNEAALRGDDRAAAMLREAVELLMADQTIDRRRQWDRDRKRESRKDTPRYQVESGGIRGQADSPPSGFSPTPPFPNPPESKTTTPRGREASETAEAEYAEMVELLTGQLAQQTGEDWPVVDAFVKRREYVTWKGWLTALLSQLTGGHATSADLAQVCRDDEALKRPIGSPKGLRAFVGDAVRERHAQSVPRIPVAGRHARPKPQQYDYPEAADPSKPIKWTA